MTRFERLNERYAAAASVAAHGVEMLTVGDSVGAYLNAAIKELIVLARSDGPELWADLLGAARQLRWRLVTEPQPIELNPQLPEMARTVNSQAERLHAAVGDDARTALSQLEAAALDVGQRDPVIGPVLVRCIEEVGAESCLVLAAGNRSVARLNRWFADIGLRAMVVSGIARSGDGVVEQAYAVGPPRIFPPSAVTSPTADAVMFVFPSWETNRSIPRTVLSTYTEGAIRPHSRIFTEGEDPVLVCPAPDVAGGSGDNRNLRLTVPVLRFPRWCFCMYCKRLKLSTLTMRQAEYCPDPICTARPYKSRMSQVPFVTICPRGHLDDFPFDKWVHHSLSPSCRGPLRLVSRGGGALAGQYVVCEGEGCKEERSLGGILDASRPFGGDETTTLTERLAPGEKYECRGAQPWLDDDGSGCGEAIRGALRAAGNVYFPKIESSIYLPRHEGAISAELHELMRRQDVGPVLKVLRTAFGDGVTVTQLRESLPYDLFAPVTDDQLTAAYRDLFGIGEEPPAGIDDQHEVLTANDEWRHPEYKLLRETPQDDYLTAADPGIAPDLADVLDRVRRVDVVRETRALRGFTRVRDGSLRLSHGKALLRRRALPAQHDWLPAYVVKGEGIYLELSATALHAWEIRQAVKDRADLIAQRYGVAAHDRGLEDRSLSPRLVLLHTLAHLLINELVFTCGYSSASLRERLYVSEDARKGMAGVLLYTAAGDSEGTMGGLVRMARPANLRAVFAGALSNARWCSTDPVCMEVGQAGQGPDSCNLAACHGCALLPETSCEEFNRFLDRGLVIGTFDAPGLGYFSS